MLTIALIFTSAFLAECGPGVSPETTQAIIKVESGGNPLAIGDNNLRRSFSPKSREEAVDLASRLIDDGHSIDIGLMQINNQHIPALKLSLADLFDPCKNIRVGTFILLGFYRQHRTGDPAQSLFKALSAYNTGRSWRGTAYINRILSAVGAEYRVTPPPAPHEGSQLQARRRRSLSEPPPSSSLFFENVSSAMGARGL